MNNHSELVREKLIEELKSLPTQLRYYGHDYCFDTLADFILARDKKNAEPLKQLDLNYVAGPKAHTPLEFITAIHMTLKNLGAE